jgi:hypothetical protein
MWLGDDKVFFWSEVAGIYPNHYHVQWASTGTGYSRLGTLEILKGGPTQELVDSAGDAQTYAGQHLLASGLSPDAIYGRRGVIAVMAFNDQSFPAYFLVGGTETIPAFSYEASSYRAHSWLQNSAHHRIGDDANPMCVAYDLMTGTLGKGAIPTSEIHEQSWAQCAATLYAEGHGMSGAFSQTRPLADHLFDLCRQIGGILYEDPSDGLIHATLIRPNSDVFALREINKSNCKSIVNFAIGSQRDQVSRVRVVYSSREHDYNDRDAVSSMSHLGEMAESQLSFPYCTTKRLAYILADRELAQRCRPVIKMRAIVDRSFYDVVPGQLVRVKWTAPDIADLVFRVARVDRGTLSDGQIGLDLILDTSYRAPRLPSLQDPAPPRDKGRIDPRQRHDEF